MRFILLDDIIDLVPGRSVHAVKTLRSSEPLFADHFPGFPVVPGVLLIEMMAQAAGKCFDVEDRTRGKAMLVQVKNAAFRQWVRPDEELHIYADIVADAPHYGSAACRIVLNDVEVTRAELLFAFVPYSQFSTTFVDEVLERYLTQRCPPSAE